MYYNYLERVSENNVLFTRSWLSELRAFLVVFHSIQRNAVRLHYKYLEGAFKSNVLFTRSWRSEFQAFLVREDVQGCVVTRRSSQRKTGASASHRNGARCIPHCSPFAALVLLSFVYVRAGAKMPCRVAGSISASSCFPAQRRDKHHDGFEPSSLVYFC